MGGGNPPLVALHRSGVGTGRYPTAIFLFCGDRCLHSVGAKPVEQLIKATLTIAPEHNLAAYDAAYHFWKIQRSTIYREAIRVKTQRN